MENLQNLHKEFSCRTCLENLNNTHHYDILKTPELQTKFTMCTSLPVEPDDIFPTSLCELCHTKINDFYNFQLMCISAMKQFQDYTDSERKTCKLEFAEIESNNFQPHFVMLNETKTEDEEKDPIFDVDCAPFVEADLSNVKSQDESSSDDEESERSQPIDNCRVSDEDNSSNDYTKFNEDEDIDDVKPVSKKKTDRSLIMVNLECKICKKYFKKAETFQAHMRIHEGLKPFPCQLCDKSYARRSRLKGHIKAKHEGRPEEKFPCTEPGCDKAMSSKQTLRKHIKDIHCANGSKTKQPYICEECGKVLTSLATLKNHRYLHTGQQLPHECPQCQKRYITKNKLKEHMNRHAGIRNYTCPHCGAKKSTRSELKTHINYHTKEKTYPCPFCDMVFNSIGNLSRHKRIVHEGIKDFPCSYCDKSFGKAETRKHHEMTHTGEKPHECKICHKKFIQPVALKKHTKIHQKAPRQGHSVW